MNKYKYIYYYINIMHTIGISIWSGTIYLYMFRVGYNYGKINLFLGIFWIITFFAEIPSGYIADKIGYLKTIMISCVIRAIGLLILALNSMNLCWMLFSAIFTAIGDSLQSGTMNSWIANKAVKENKKQQLSFIYSGYGLIATPITMLATFIGSNILGNINLKLPLIVGATFLIITSFTIVPLLKYDSQSLIKIKNVIPTFSLIKDLKMVMNYEMKTLKLIFLFLPISIISSGPLDQWQLYFQKGKVITSGTISVFMTLSGMVAIAIYNRVAAKNKLTDTSQMYLIVISTIILTITTLETVEFRHYYYISLCIFMIHTMFGSIDSMVSGLLLQTSIKIEDQRATVISIYNALDAGIEIIILTINGYLSDHYGIGVAWITLAILGMFAFLILYINTKINKRRRW